MMTHVPNFDLERLACDDVTAAQREQMTQHLAGCEQCTALLRSHVSFMTEQHLPSIRFVAEKPARRWHWQWLFAPALAACALVIALVDTGEDSLRSKGGSLSVFRKRPGQEPQLISKGKALAVGDALRVVISSDKERTVRLWFMSARGELLGFPSDTPLHLRSGQRAIEESVLITAPCEQQWLVLASEALEPQLRAIAKARQAGSEPAWPAGAEVVELQCD